MNPNEPSDKNGLQEQLQRLLLALEMNGYAILPHTHDALLRSIVEAAARIFGAAAASIALVNEKDQTLDFKVSYGAGHESVEGMRIPLDKGIAGYVAMTGQPIATSRVKEDNRFNQTFAQSTGYVPDSILCTPLLSGDRVIGVMEVLDKIEQSSFGIQDMELLGLFARQAAIAIHQSQQYERLGETLVTSLKRFAENDSIGKATDLLQALELVGHDTAERDDLLALADLFNELSSLGDAEREACLKIMRAFAEYSKTKTRLFYG